MKTLATALLLCLALVPASTAAQAANVTGNWDATFTATRPDGTSQSITFTFHLTQKGKVVTGTIGPTPERQWKVEKGIVDGAKVTFEAQQTDTSRPLRSFTLTLVKDRLQGTQTLSANGQTAEVKVEAVRAKAK